MAADRQRRWGAVVAITLLVIGVSFSTYRAPLPWLKYGLLEALLDTYQALPTGAGFPPSLVEAMTTLLAQSFELAVRAAAPAMTALLLATLLLGLVSRTLPQLNAMQIGFGINSFVTLGMLSISMGAVAWLFQEQIDPAFELLLSSLAAG